MPRIVLVTGCASGIGLETATRFALAGDTVIATVRSLARSSDLQARLSATDAVTEVLELDVTDDDAATSVVQDVLGRYGTIDVLINNAGVAVEGTLEDLDLDVLKRSMDVNFLGAVRVTKAALRSMREARSGRIIVVSSISGAVGLPFQEPYSAAKFALEGLFESFAPVAAEFGVYVTLVEPGPVGTDFMDNPLAHASIASEPYTAMYDAFVQFRAKAFLDCPLPADTAELIFRTAGDPEPPLRVQDTEASRKTVENKLRDVDGARVMRSRALFRQR